MAEYRAYFIGHSGYIISQSPIECSEDAEAIQQAKQLVGRYAVELWSGDRLVTRLHAQTLMPQQPPCRPG